MTHETSKSKFLNFKESAFSPPQIEARVYMFIYRYLLGVGIDTVKIKFDPEKLVFILHM